jgi:hypothetical protein
MVSVRLLYYQRGQFFPEDVMDMGRAVFVELFRATHEVEASERAGGRYCQKENIHVEVQRPRHVEPYSVYRIIAVSSDCSM